MYTHVNNDIKFDESVEMNKDKKREMIQDYNNNGMDQELLKELRTSIHADSSDSEFDANTPNNTPISVLTDSPYNSDLNSSGDKNDNDIDNEYHIGSSISLMNPEKGKNTSKTSKSLKDILKRNVAKVGNMLHIFKPPTPTKTAKSYSHEDIANAFSQINSSCDTLLYNSSGVEPLADHEILMNDNGDIDNNVIMSDYESPSNEVSLISEDTNQVLLQTNIPTTSDSNFEKVEEIEKVEKVEEPITNIQQDNNIIVNTCDISEENKILPSQSETDSIVSTITQSDNSCNGKTVQETASQGSKPKRKYTPRKKKTDAPL
jgi:hypothetical protein